MSERATDVLRWIENHLEDRIFVMCPVPLDDPRGYVANLDLPTDLTPVEAGRISEMVQAWAFPEQAEADSAGANNP